MADKGPSSLTAAGTLDGTEVLHVVKSGNSRKTTPADILAVQHAHAIADVTGLQTALDAKIDDSQAGAGGLAVLGAADAAAVQAAANLVPGTDVQAYDAQLDDIAGLSYASNALKVVRVNAGETAFELADLAGVSIRTATGTTDTLVIGDANNVVELTNSGAITLTIPPNSSVAFDVGTVIEIHQGGSGTVTVDPDTGVTLVSRGSVFDLAGQEAVAFIRKVDADKWRLGGDIA